MHSRLAALRCHLQVPKLQERGDLGLSKMTRYVIGILFLFIPSADRDSVTLSFLALSHKHSRPGRRQGDGIYNKLPTSGQRLGSSPGPATHNLGLITHGRRG